MNQARSPLRPVLAEVSSIEAKRDLVIDSRLANEGDSWAGSGANPWHLDNETESILFLTDMGDKEAVTSTVWVVAPTFSCASAEVVVPAVTIKLAISRGGKAFDRDVNRVFSRHEFRRQCCFPTACPSRTNVLKGFALS